MKYLYYPLVSCVTPDTMRILKLLNCLISDLMKTSHYGFCLTGEYVTAPDWWVRALRGWITFASFFDEFATICRKILCWYSRY